MNSPKNFKYRPKMPYFFKICTEVFEMEYIQGQMDMISPWTSWKKTHNKVSEVHSI
jgi:hypothetical protein